MRSHLEIRVTRFKNRATRVEFLTRIGGEKDA